MSERTEPVMTYGATCHLYKRADEWSARVTEAAKDIARDEGVQWVIHRHIDEAIRVVHESKYDLLALGARREEP